MTNWHVRRVRPGHLPGLHSAALMLGFSSVGELGSCVLEVRDASTSPGSVRV